VIHTEVKLFVGQRGESFEMTHEQLVTQLYVTTNLASLICVNII